MFSKSTSYTFSNNHHLSGDARYHVWSTPFVFDFSFPPQHGLGGAHMGHTRRPEGAHASLAMTPGAEASHMLE